MQTKTSADTKSDLNAALQGEGIEILGPVPSPSAEILTQDAVRCVASLAGAFTVPREALLQRRVAVQARIDAGSLPDFLPETEAIRKSAWQVAPVPADLQDRRVEITGP